MPVLPYHVVVIESMRYGKTDDYAAYATQWEACAIANAINREDARHQITAEVWVIQVDGTRKRLQ